MRTCCQCGRPIGDGHERCALCGEPPEGIVPTIEQAPPAPRSPGPNNSSSGPADILWKLAAKDVEHRWELSWGRVGCWLGVALGLLGFVCSLFAERARPAEMLVSALMPLFFGAIFGFFAILFAALLQPFLRRRSADDIRLSKAIEEFDAAEQRAARAASPRLSSGQAGFGEPPGPVLLWRPWRTMPRRKGAAAAAPFLRQQRLDHLAHATARAGFRTGTPRPHGRPGPRSRFP
jgi:hypothetical protein